MKTMKLLSFFILVCLFTNVNAQLRVLSNGRLQVGLLKDANEDLGNVTSMQLFGRIGDNRAGSKLSFGDFGRYENQGWNVFMGEYGTTDTDQLWLHGKLGMYLTSTGYANKVVAYYDPAINSTFVFNTGIRINGVDIPSDVRLKENIQSIQAPLDILCQMNGVSYTYSSQALQNMRKNSRSAFAGTQETETIDMSMDAQASTNALASDKEIKDKQLQQKIEKRELAEASRKRIGFLAQDIQKVLPELVQTDDNGVMSIDYIGFIPLIVESIKEMSQTIAAQNEEIENLRSLLPAGVGPKLRASSVSTGDIISLEGAKLFNREGTSVSYSLPAAFNTADLRIFDITGKILKTISLKMDEDVVDVDRSEIGYGTFVYALFVDGKKADTLKKYISK